MTDPNTFEVWETSQAMPAIYPAVKNSKDYCDARSPWNRSCTREKNHTDAHESSFLDGKKRLALARWYQGKEPEVIKLRPEPKLTEGLKLEPWQDQNHVKAVFGKIIQEARKDLYQEGSQNKFSDAKVLGELISKYLDWEPYEICMCFASALVDCNYPELAKQAELMGVQPA